MRYRLHPLLFLALICFLFLTGFTSLSVHSPRIEPGRQELLSGEPFIYRIHPEPRGGEAYKLIYVVPVPPEVFWKFKTDFAGDFLRTNKYVKDQRVIRRKGNVVVIENRLSHKSEAVFRWRNTLHPNEHRLDYILENPAECDQRFHYGHFRLETIDSFTKVTHLAYFDFFGSSLWALYPWEGGMSTFLEYIARWEQKTVFRLRDDYQAKSSD